MPLPTVSFLLGLLVLGYLFTFIVFALLRIATGVSIQRVGYSGFRHIAFSLRQGVDVSIRGVGLKVHRPTFALPTWCSLVVTELVVTVDLLALDKSPGGAANHGLFEGANGGTGGTAGSKEPSRPGTPAFGEDEEGRGKLWRRLTHIKEKIKKLHSKINWIRLVDLVATETKLQIVGVGSLQVERVMLSVDTRIQTVDRSRLFQHHKTQPETQAPAEWKSLFRSILFTPEGRESTEILDYVTVNIHGMLHNELQGLRDASIALKLGRLNVPFDDIEQAKKCADLLRGRYAQPHAGLTPPVISVNDALQPLEDEKLGGRSDDDDDDRMVRNVSDSRAFIASMLRGIQEVQFAIGFFGLSRRMDVKSDSGKDVYFNLAMKELGLDVVRLDPKSAAHRMYFSRRDVAHQGMLTAISISAGIDDGHEHPERMLYIPMITATVKTTLPSRTIHYRQDNDAQERNTNMLYANFVCTSPSIDLDPKHLPTLLSMLKQRRSHEAAPPSVRSNRHQLISQLLPKAYVKLAIQEPVIRVSLPPMDKSNAASDDFDLLISSSSTISLELESSHAAEGSIHYNLATKYRQTRHHVYYQTHVGERHELLQSESLELQVDVSGIPDASVVASGRFQTFTLFLVRPEICIGVRQIVKQLRRNVLASHRKDNVSGEIKPRPSFLRTVPQWLTQCRIEGSDFGLELAGVDELVSKDTRGFALQLESWTTEYKAHREEQPDMFTRRSSLSRTTPLRDIIKRETSPRRRLQSLADGRRLTVHLQNLEGYVVDSVETSKPDPVMSLPRFEIAFSTRTDSNGPIFHINSHARSVLLQYSLYNFFAISIAVMVIRKTFLEHDEQAAKMEGSRASGAKPSRRAPSLTVPGSNLTNMDEIALHEVTSIDFKANLVQVKARLPADPPMMVQLYGVESGQHRWGTPFVKCKLSRMYVRAPLVKTAWSRIVSIKTLRLDLRELKRKAAHSASHTSASASASAASAAAVEKSIDVVTEHVRFAVPHGLLVHDIFDNIANVVKTTKQLQHHFRTGTNEYVLTKEPEGPKRVPRITFRTQVLMFDVEDSSFEWKINAIYRAGLQEQKQRTARDEAFKLKEKRLARTAHRSASKSRAQSAHMERRSRSQTRPLDGVKQRSNSAHTGSRADSGMPHHGHQRTARRKMRYDADGTCGFSDTSHLSIEAARDRLKKLNSQSWKNRIDHTLNLQTNIIHEIRSIFFGDDEIVQESEQQEPIMALNQRPGLIVIVISDLAITVDKPSFPVDQYPQFLHEVGKGMPHDMKYGLLIPMSLHITMGELRFQLRDYPLPLLHVPALSSGQSARLPSLAMRTDFVIAEEFRDVESQRMVDVRVVPPERTSDGAGFAVNVQRTISPVKMYSNMKFEINTSNPTKITWGTSYQPAIQDAMQVIEGFTKPPVDPSDRVGFWDKIRLSFHSRVNVAWKGDGDVHLILKGSRDPYVVTGQGGGLVMVWRNDVRWNIAQSEDPRQFMTVDSTDYILAVPDFTAYARRSIDGDDGDDGAAGASIASSSSTRRDATFKKVVMKLSGNVRWLAGMMFERDLQGGGRSFEFKPHYDVVLKHPDFAKSSSGAEYDAYSGFRSNHIHMSVAVTAPHDRQWSLGNLKPSDNYNAIHLTPKFFSHFFSWWSMFSGVMSLPIRQGSLWGPMQKKSKKFGRHVATFKYNLLLSPLYVSHVYKHKDAEDYKETVVSATGLKMRLDSFMLDLHQRREYFDIKGHEGAQSKQSSGLRIHQAQLDFIHANLRALSASITGTSTEDIEKATDETLASLYGQIPAVDMQNFDIPDNDFDWVDMDDFVELDWILPAESDPETKILPLGYAPRFTYFRQTDHGGTIAGDPTRSSPFGDEPTHHCVMSGRNDPRRVQAELIQKRLRAMKEHRERTDRLIGEQELKIIRDASDDKRVKEKLKDTLEKLKVTSERIQTKSQFLERMLNTLSDRLEKDDPAAVPDLETSEEFYEAHENVRRPTDDLVNLTTAPLADYTSDFNNRFIVHNAQIKWNNSLRNIILRYIHQNSQRRGFVYYMSQRAIKFILDIIEEKKKADEATAGTRTKSTAPEDGPISPDGDDDATIQARIDQLLQDGRDFVNAEEATGLVNGHTSSQGKPNKDEIAIEYTPLNTYHFRLIAPQVQLQSEKNPKAAVLVSAKGMQLKVVQIMDKERVSDDVSGLVQMRFTAAADSVQMFVTTLKSFTTEQLQLFVSNTWGTKKGEFWPPWVPMEIIYEFQTIPYGFQRVVDQTSASLRYDKYNSLRLKYNDTVSGDHQSTSAGDHGHDHEAEQRMDHVWLEFPRFRAICDSAQYFALYIIVMDLLLYNEPLEKTRSERLEKIMLASDFSDLSGAPEMVHMLQDRIRQLEEIKMHFQLNEKYLDRQGWKDRIAMDQDLAGCEDELFFMMKAITTSQQRVEDRREHDDVAGLLHLNMAAKEIVWHLIRDKGESLMEFRLENAAFNRTVNNDGSNYNCMEIGRINGLNLLPDAVYPEIIAPFIDESRGIYDQKHGRMLRVHWLMLEAIAGIPVVDYFEVDLVPLKLQIEREVARKIFEYIFPGSADGSGFSPFMVKHMLPTQEEEADREEQADAASVEDLPIAPDGDVNGPDSPLANKCPAPLESRLKPTIHLQKRTPAKPERGLGLTHSGHLHGLSVFHPSERRSTPSIPTARSNASRAALSSISTSAAMSRSPSERSLVTSTADSEKKKNHFTLRRSRSYERVKEKDKDKEKDRGKEKEKVKKNARSDDLTEMMSRASNYMTLAFVKIPGVVLCLSYRGQGKRNIEDVHDLVFRLPTLEYRNKTWSNLDLALQLKKDVIRALISHAGAIVTNKLSQHKPSKQQQIRSREMAHMITSMSPSASGLHLPSSDASSLTDSRELPQRPSTSSTRPDSHHYAASYHSTPSASSADFGFQGDGSGSGLSNGTSNSNGHAAGKGQVTPRRRLSLPRSSPYSGDGEQSRPRATSITRHISGFGERLRQRQMTESNIGPMAAAGNHVGDVGEAEEHRRKSRLLLGGQKFLRSLRDS